MKPTAAPIHRTRARSDSLRRPDGRPIRAGKVYLIGSGPGDPELLTLRAARILAQADAVVYDHLVGTGVIDWLPEKLERIYVGKEPGRHTLPQAQINTLLVRLAKQGRVVVRLKGGDPFVFGRGGEEIEELVACGVPFEIVPGITAASGMAAYAGIPLTHRDLAQSCVFVTGHLKDGGCELDWPALARPRQTVVVYMGMGSLAQICRRLVEHGLPGETPAAVVRNATNTDQVTILGDLATLPRLAADRAVSPPALIVVGETVALAHRLGWFRPVDPGGSGPRR
jgi:uroporphyrin-III C-methyltransferase